MGLGGCEIEIDIIPPRIVPATEECETGCIALLDFED